MDVKGGASVITVRTAAASLTVDAPTHMRGGLIFTSRFEIQAEQPLADARIRLANGWFQGMTFNGIAPQPKREASLAGWTEFDYGRIDAGQTFTVWMSWQVDPTNVGRHVGTVVLLDGSKQIAAIPRTVVVLP
jgi:hypothetical protein